MENPREWWVRLRHLWRRSEAEREMEEEIRFHLEKETEKNVRAGMSSEAARRAALVAFGGVERVREEARDEVRPRLLEDAWQDARYALRGLRRSPSFALVAVLTLGLGIGANTAVFSAVSAVLLRPLPFAEPDRLVMVWEENAERGWERAQVSPANALDWAERVAGFADLAMYADFEPRVTLTGEGRPQVLETGVVTGNFFSVLGVRPALGRTLREEETWRDAEPVVVLSHRAWTERFGGDPEVVGRAILLDGVSHQIVGVMPEGFGFPSNAVDAWRGFGWDREAREAVWFRRAHFARAVARLAPGVTHEAAAAQLRAVVERLQAEHPETNAGMGAGMTPLHEFLVGDTRTPLLVVFAAVGVLLLLACVNVGNLLLVRWIGRRQELAARGALGASRWRLVRQAVAESLVLSAAGGALGLALGIGGTRVLELLRPPELLGDGALTPDWRVLGFTLLTTVASGLLFSVAPAVRSFRSDTAAILREGGRGGDGGRGARAGARALVIAEVALAVVLVTGAGLLVRSFVRLQSVDPGFDGRGVIAVGFDLPASRYDSAEKLVAFYDALVREVGALPGVVSAGAVRQLPLTSPGWTSDFTVEGWPADWYGTEVVHREVMPGYFRTLRVPTLRGRTFTAADLTGPNVVVVNHALARRYFPDTDPIGKRLGFDRVPDSTTVWRTIVGVVGDERQGSPAAEPRMEIFAPLSQEPTLAMTLVARASGDPAALVPAIRRVAAEIDPDLALFDVRTLDMVRGEAVARERFLMVLLALFGAVALVLAMVGVYGVISQTVRQQSREMGVRLALGARPVDVLRRVVRGGAALVALGVAIGTAAALFATRSMRALLFETAPTDPATLASVALLLLLAGLAAAAIPARRASRTDPAVVLRE